MRFKLFCVIVRMTSSCWRMISSFLSRLILSLRSVGRVRHRAEQECSDQAAERAREERHQQQKRQIVERRGRAERDERGADLPAVVRRRARDRDAEDAELFRLAEQQPSQKSADSPPSSENSSAEALPANSAPSVQRTSNMASALGKPRA